MKYDYSGLWSAQFFRFYELKGFLEYASDKESQINYYKHLGATHFGENGKLEIIETPQVLIDAHIQANESAIEMIKNQLIVFLFTRYEFIIQEAMKCLICDDPERILKFLKVYPDYKDVIGFSLKEFVHCKSKEEYVKIISERLGLKILAGKPTNVVKRLKCLLDFESIDITALDDLMIKRNSIVHEGRIYKIELNELEAFYTALDELLKSLALSLKNNNISVIDDGQLLTEE